MSLLEKLDPIGWSQCSSGDLLCLTHKAARVVPWAIGQGVHGVNWAADWALSGLGKTLTGPIGGLTTSGIAIYAGYRLIKNEKFLFRHTYQPGRQRETSLLQRHEPARHTIQFLSPREMLRPIAGLGLIGFGLTSGAGYFLHRADGTPEGAGEGAASHDSGGRCSVNENEGALGWVTGRAGTLLGIIPWFVKRINDVITVSFFGKFSHGGGAFVRGMTCLAATEMALWSGREAARSWFPELRPNEHGMLLPVRSSEPDSKKALAWGAFSLATGVFALCTAKDLRDIVLESSFEQPELVIGSLGLVWAAVIVGSLFLQNRRKTHV